jgi:excisionase family DNA binding protein
MRDEINDDRVSRVLVKPERAAQMLDISRATVYRMLADGSLERVILPGKRLVRVPMDAIERLRNGAK